MYYSNSDIYEGQWCKDKPDGEGMLRLKNGNRYEGSWQRGMKNGFGRFFHLNHGQLFEGFWVDDVAKCGTMIDFGRDEAPEPTQFPIPKVKLLDPDGVLQEALARLKKTEEEEGDRCQLPPPASCCSENTQALEEIQAHVTYCSDRCGSCGGARGTPGTPLAPSKGTSFLAALDHSLPIWPVLLSPAGLGDPLVTALPSRTPSLSA
ncbi:MORN repeat-containing protein 3 isoform X5 [Equus przewalskii]